MDSSRSGLAHCTITQSPPESENNLKKLIRAMPEASVKDHYVLGNTVAESLSIGTQVIFATRREDKVEVVIKMRQRANSFASELSERQWRATLEYQLNIPKTPGLCEVHEVLETPIAYYVVMEKCLGKDIFEQLGNKSTREEVREAVRQILDALKMLHGNGLVHKDLKCENVVVDTNLKEPPSQCTSSIKTKIIDFDTMINWGPDSPRAKHVGGTAGYIAPEAYSGHYSPASDVYSTGVILYKLLTRNYPYRCDLFDDKPCENYVGSKAMNRIKENLKDERIDFNIPPLNIDLHARNLVRRMLAYDPDFRPSASEALADIWFEIRRLPHSPSWVPSATPTRKPHSDASTEEVRPPKLQTADKSKSFKSTTSPITPKYELPQPLNLANPRVRKTSPKNCTASNVAGEITGISRHIPTLLHASTLGS